jgi:hypothetical protein
MSEGNLRLTASGTALLMLEREAGAAWARVLQRVHLAILIDCDVKDILRVLSSAWEALAWYSHQLEEAGGQDVLFVFPIGPEPIPPVGLFRPASYSVIESLLKSFPVSPFPATVALVGGRVVGLSKEAVESAKQVPEFLVWAAKRFLNEEYLVQPIEQQES